MKSFKFSSILLLIGLFTFGCNQSSVKPDYSSEAVIAQRSARVAATKVTSQDLVGNWRVIYRGANNNLYNASNTPILQDVKFSFESNGYWRVTNAPYPNVGSPSQLATEFDQAGSHGFAAWDSRNFSGFHSWVYDAGSNSIQLYRVGSPQNPWAKDYNLSVSANGTYYYLAHPQQAGKPYEEICITRY